MTTAQQTIKRSLDTETQLRLLEQIKKVRSISPFRSLQTPGGRKMSVKVTAAGELGWLSDERGYRYVDRDLVTGQSWPHLPWEWVEIANSVVEIPQPWDSAIINWYGPEANLGMHVDNSEADFTRPIVTISLGDSAVWVLRQGDGGSLTSCSVLSGDVTVLDGETRLWPHGITRIIPQPLLSPLGAKRGRVSITLRVAGVVT